MRYCIVAVAAIVMAAMVFQFGCRDKSVEPPMKNSRDCTWEQRGEWTLIGLRNEDVTVIAPDPKNPRKIFVGSSSDFSAGKVGGIFLSTNAGECWDTLLRGVTVRDIDINPSNSSIIYLTSGLNFLAPSGILKSTNGGKTWFESGPKMVVEEGPITLAIDPIHPETLYVGSGGPFGGSLYMSRDNGSTWSDIAAGHRPWRPGDPEIGKLRYGVTCLAIDSESTNVIYAATPGRIMKSTDFGNTWFEPNQGTELNAMIYAIEFGTNRDMIFIGGAPGSDPLPALFRTLDGGVTWHNLSVGLPGSATVYAIDFTSESRMYMAVDSGDFGGIYSSDDLGLSWAKIGIDSLRTNTVRYMEGGVILAGAKGIFRRVIQ